MLSRVAESVFWMSRQIERAENLSRFLEVTWNLTLDQPENLVDPWEPLIRVTADDEYFRDRYGVPNAENVTQFLAFDSDYSSSMIALLPPATLTSRDDIVPSGSAASTRQPPSGSHSLSPRAGTGTHSPRPGFLHSVVGTTRPLATSETRTCHPAPVAPVTSRPRSSLLQDSVRMAQGGILNRRFDPRSQKATGWRQGWLPGFGTSCPDSRWGRPCLRRFVD